MEQLELFNSNNKQHSWFEDALKFLDIDPNKPAWTDDFGSKINLALKNKVSLNILSLFSGGGGLDIAFGDVGFNILECVEIEKKFTKTLQANIKFEDTKITCADIRKFNSNYKTVDFIIGGPPCQTFSAAGVRAAGVNGIDDERGTLFEEYVRILQDLKPQGFLFENVYRIVGAQKGKPWRLIQKAFKNAGYRLFWRIIDAADYGTPQHRERLIIIGLKKGNFFFPYPTHGPDSKDNRPYYNSGLATKGTDISNCKIGINGRHGYLLDDIPPGLNYSFYTEKLGHPNPIFGWRSKFSDYLYKADPKTPVRTIKAQGGQYTGPFSWKNRPFTIDEIKRLQTFPDEYKIIGNRQTVIMQLGNSFPPQTGRILALSVLNQVFKIELPFSIDHMPDNFQLGFRKRKSALSKIYATKAKNAIQKLTLQGKIKSSRTANDTGCNIQYLHTNLELTDTDSIDAIDFSIDFCLNKKSWILNCNSLDEKNKKFYEFSINLSEKHKLLLGTKSVTLASNRNDYWSITALWKFLEKLIKKYAHKDDLIQLFGYYQYRSESVIKLSVFDDELKKKHFWKLIDYLNSGLIPVGKSIRLSEIQEITETDSKICITSLKLLKEIGFEIRSHKTNPQIQKDSYLLPYPFPTLNGRSLQRLTNL